MFCDGDTSHSRLPNRQLNPHALAASSPRHPAFLRLSKPGCVKNPQGLAHAGNLHHRTLAASLSPNLTNHDGEKMPQTRKQPTNPSPENRNCPKNLPLRHFLHLQASGKAKLCSLGRRLSSGPKPGKRTSKAKSQSASRLFGTRRDSGQSAASLFLSPLLSCYSSAVVVLRFCLA